MGATPQVPDDVIAWMKRVEADLSLLHERVNNPLANTGLSVPAPGQVEADGFFHVVGTMHVDSDVGFNAGISANTLQVISGITFLPNQSILNNWLANPLLQASVSPSVTNFAVTTSMATLASQTFTIPAGYTAVHVDVTAKVGAVNSTASADYIYARPKIVRVSDGATYFPTTPGTSVAASAEGVSMARTVADIGLAAGDSVQIVVQGQTAFAGWAANASNYADVVGTLTWYRP